MPSYIQEYAPGLSFSSYRPSWRVGAMGTMYKRGPSGGLRGAAMKLNCCADSKCVFLGNSFTCVATSDIELEKEMEDEMEVEENAFPPRFRGN